MSPKYFLCRLINLKLSFIFHVVVVVFLIVVFLIVIYIPCCCCCISNSYNVGRWNYGHKQMCKFSQREGRKKMKWWSTALSWQTNKYAHQGEARTQRLDDRSVKNLEKDYPTGCCGDYLTSLSCLRRNGCKEFLLKKTKCTIQRTK
jgi:hypothetical protein